MKRIGLSFRSALAAALSCLLVSPSAGWQQAAPRSISIVIVEGDGAINNIRQRIAREPIVEVVDENKNPVPGAAVTFLLPQNGASGVFPNGSRMLTSVTGPDGRAVARGIRINNTPGQWQMRVTASFQGQSASATIGMTNAAVAAAGIAASAKLWAILAAVGGAAAAGAVIATRGDNGTPTRPPTSVAPGTPTVGPPR